MIKANIFNIQRYCLHDGPGIRTAVFFKGCGLRCPWCHNPESQNAEKQLMYYESKCVGCKRCIGLCEARKISETDPSKIVFSPEKCTLCGKCTDECMHGANEICGYEADVNTVFEQVLQDKIFYKDGGGMTLTGGEPALQPEAAVELLRLARENGINSVVETSGYGSKSFFENAALQNAEFYFDIKTLDFQKHIFLTGVPCSEILKNLRFLMDNGVKTVIRIPLIPGFNDSEGELLLLAEFLKENENKYDRAEIMKYHNLGKNKAKALSREYTAPQENATDIQAENWLLKLKELGAKKIYFSD